MHLHRVTDTWTTLRDTRSRTAKADAVATLLAEAQEWLGLVVSYLAGELPQGRIGVGYAAVRDASTPAADISTLTLRDVDGTFDAIASASGPGSKGEKQRLLTDLLARATENEQAFLRGLVLGELRQGALEGVMVDAIARAADVDRASVRRALMLTGDLGVVADAALGIGGRSLDEFRLRLFRPLQPMLAQSAEDVAEALSMVGGDAAAEWKLDGTRIQVHKEGDRVAVYTRSLRDVTGQLPEVVAAIDAVDAATAIFDGEALGIDAGGRPLPFQDTMSQFGTDDPGALVPILFDCLHLDGTDLIDLPAAERWRRLQDAAPPGMLIPRLPGVSVADGEAFFEDAVAAGHEGLVVKALDSPYEAGRRGASWVKVKATHTLDLVVLAVEWGSGRRQGFLSNIHLGARDPESGDFVMLGKTFKGMTDEMLAWQTDRFLELETHREGHVVHVRPEQVVEIAFDGVLRSTRYPGGMALRFARVKRYRQDKTAAEADTIDAVRRIHAG